MARIIGSALAAALVVLVGVATLGRWPLADVLAESATDPLPGLVVVAAAPPEVAGYDRSCRHGHRCVFGHAWTDDVDVAGGHDGCDTRNGILRSQLRDVEIRPGTRGCVVVAGTLDDPYGGGVVGLADVQVDHVFPLSGAWSRGAAGWSLQRRKDFANDPRNLVATTSVVNRAKNDKMPGRWLPATAAGRCGFASRFVEVARIYQLTITKAENAALTKALAGCPSAGG
ncbi:MAG: HNH endonuclease [Propionicimonas sp.]|nr:HNH endonuclease [Propionicimonas sp.]MBU4208034.1 HNH endonuclease family protein [Actinomycetota bacterium]MBU4411512.1 HNH endonuclease family protein [Actinomycetota bacterium]